MSEPEAVCKTTGLTFGPGHVIVGCTEPKIERDPESARVQRDARSFNEKEGGVCLQSNKHECLIMAFALVSFTLAVASLASCSFVAVNNSSRRRSLGGYWSVGLSAYESDTGGGLGCEHWSRFDSDKRYYDPMAKMTRVSGILAASLTGVSLLYIVLSKIVVPANKTAWNCIRVLYAVAAVFQCLTLLAFKSDLCNDQYSYAPYCTIGPAGVVAALNALLLLIGSVLLWKAPPPAGPRFNFSGWIQRNQKRVTLFVGSIALIGLIVGLVVGCGLSNDTGNNVWLPKGQVLYGRDYGDRFGISVALSSNGQILGVGAPQSESGYASLYQNVGQEWVKIGTGEADEEFGQSVALSADGSILAAGDGSDYVRVYHMMNGSLFQLGADIMPEESGDRFGHSISLADDGKTIAVGSPGFSNVATPSFVSIFQWNDLTRNWEQVGPNLFGPTASFFGTAVSLSGDGRILTVLSAGGERRANPGQWQYVRSSCFVRTFELLDQKWSQLGHDLIPQAGEVKECWSISLSSGGTHLAVGDENGYDRSGAVITYSWDEDKFEWLQLGNTLFGEEDSLFGFSVSLSSDASALCVGAQMDNYVRLYEWDNTKATWRKMGARIGAMGDRFERNNDRFGFSVALSSDGKAVAAGAPQFNYDGSGYVAVLHRSTENKT